MIKDYEWNTDLIVETRIKLWADVAIAYTSASNATNKNKVAQWCDQVLADFDERFSQKILP